MIRHVKAIAHLTNEASGYTFIVHHDLVFNHVRLLLPAFNVKSAGNHRDVLPPLQHGCTLYTMYIFPEQRICVHVPWFILKIDSLDTE